MKCVILRNFTDVETKEKYISGHIKEFTEERVKAIRKVEEKKEIKLIREVKNNGLEKESK